MHRTGYPLLKQLFVSGTALSLVLALAANAAWASPQIRIARGFFYSAINDGALRCSPGGFSFGSVLAGASKILPGTLSNTGTTNITVYSVSQNLAEFSLGGLSLPVILAPKQTVDFQVTFAPGTGGHVDGNFSFSTDASSAPLVVGVHGTGATKGLVTASPANVNFGSPAAGGTAARAEVLTNSGTAPLSITEISVSGAGFSISGVSLPLRLIVGQSVSLNLAFRAQPAGQASGNLSIISNAENPSLGIPLSGGSAGAGLLGASSSSLSFGSVQLGSSSSQSETFANSGGSTVAISQVSVTGAGFSTSGLTLPLSLAPGQNFTFGVAFAPTSAGNASGTVTALSNANDSSLSIPVSGSAPSAASQHGVGLSWTRSTSQIAGYNIYRGTHPGGPYAKINPSVSANTAYTDSSVQSGQTYYYVTTAVTGGGMESGYSNQVQAAIPAAGGLAGLLAASSSTLSFGGVQMGGTQTLPETLSNTGGTSVAISQANLSGAGFSISGLTLPFTLTPGQSLNFNAVFTPTAAGNASGNLSVVSNASDAALAIALTGSGTAGGQLSVSPSALSFGGVVVGQNKSSAATLTASGSSVTISSATGHTSEFTLSGISFPLTLAAGQSAALTVTFTPQASGVISDNVSFLSSAGNSPAITALSGNGTAVAHNVVLSWTGTPSGASGYNIYRTTASGGPYTKINSGLNTTTMYTDNSVLAGHTYYYVATAVDGKGTESGYSSQIQTVIPTP